MRQTQLTNHGDRCFTEFISNEEVKGTRNSNLIVIQNEYEIGLWEI